MTQVQVQADEFIDLAAFYMAVAAVDQILAEKAEDPTRHLDVDEAQLRQHREKAQAAIRRVAPLADTGMDSILRDIFDKSKFRVKTKLDNALRGSGLAQFGRRAEFMTRFLPRLKAKSAVLRDVFGADSPKALRLIHASETENPTARLFQIAGVRMAAGGKFAYLKKWTQRATAACGNPVPEMEEIATDITATDTVFEKMATNERQLEVIDPTDPSAAALTEANADLMERADRIVQESRDPAVVKAHAVSKLAEGNKQQYRTAISEALKMTPEQEDSMIIRGKAVIAAGAGSGKCVTGDTIVSTAHGMRRIDQCVGLMHLPSVDASTLSPSLEEGQWIDMGSSPVLEIETRSGIQLRGTPEHPLLTWSGSPTWVRLDEMKPGMFVLLQPGHALGTGTPSMDPEEAYLLGLLMGDGWVDVPNRRLGWSRGGDYLPAHFYRLANQFWGKTPKSTTKVGTESITHWIHSVELVHQLEQQGMAFASARDKEVPPAILSGGDAERIRFLQGLFDTDGTATGDRVVEWLSASETLARQVHQMLIGLGVVGLLRPKHVAGYDHTYWRLIIGGDQLRTFRDMVGFRYEFKKSTDLDDICARETNPNIGVYPHVGNLLKQVREEWKAKGIWRGRAQSMLMDERWVTVKDYLLETRCPSQDRLQRLIAGCDGEAARLLRNLTGFYPDRIESITPLPGEHRVYDFTVPTTHSFIANGIVSHNTRVLAGKVVHHVQDLNMGIGNIMAVSFTRKSSAELKKRILDYAEKVGVNLPDPSSDAFNGIGTTHSIGRNILAKAGFRVSGDARDEKSGPVTGATLTNLVKVAIMQVKMKGRGATPPPIPIEAKTFFPNPPQSSPLDPTVGEIGDPAVENTSPVDNPTQSASPLDTFLRDTGLFQGLLQNALDTLRDIVKAMPDVRVKNTSSGWSIAEVYGPGIHRFGNLIAQIRPPGAMGNFSFKAAEPKFRAPERYAAFTKRGTFNEEDVRRAIRSGLGIDRAENAIKALEVFQGRDPASLSANELAILEGVITQPAVAAGLIQRGVPVSKTAADDDGYEVSEDGIESVRKRKTKFLLEDEKGPLYYWTRFPADQWFNLGVSEDDFMVEDPKTGQKRPIPIGEFTRFIGFNKNSLKAPGELFEQGAKTNQGRGEDEETDDAAELQETARQLAQRQQIFSAVYGAYEWLKGKAYPGRFDYDDMLVKAATVLVEKPNVLRQFQKQYKAVLVDEAQDLNKCVHGSTEVQTPNGPVEVRDLNVGDSILSFENGRVLYNQVTQKVRSFWDRGYRIHLTSGETLLMSPDHRIYASPPAECPDGQMALYLMFREGMGFRIGTSTRLFWSKPGSSGRAAQEHADCAWILEIGEPEEILYKEQAWSLKYAVPTYIFEGSTRGCDQSRIDRIFQEFGENGRALLSEYDLDFNYPHWVAAATDRGRITRRVVNFCAHRGKGKKKTQRGSSVTMNWTNGDFDLDVPTYTVKGGRKMVGMLKTDYAEARRVAEHVAKKAGGYLTESLCIDDTYLPLITASGLLPGMKVPVWRGGVDSRASDLLPVEAYRTLASKLGLSPDNIVGRKEERLREAHNQIHEAQLRLGLADVLPPLSEADVELVEIETVEVVQGEEDFWDIAVENAHNFFGNGILSHNCQHMLFGLISGYIDPSTLKPRTDGKMSADTFCFIGDDKQCVSVDSLVETPNGQRRAGDLKPGDAVLSFRNGEIVPQTVRHVVPSSWEKGFRITTESGRQLLMSPNHRLWATEPRTEGNQHVVYLMHRKDMGFRVGITNKGKVGSEGDYLNSFGGRAFLEKAERLWVIDICDSREAALLEETRTSLKYGIPTTVFNGEHRGINTDRIDALFAEFGANGAKLLEARHLSFDHPHWMSQSYTKHGRERHTINLLAHTHAGTQVLMEWTGDKFDEALSFTPLTVVGERRRLRRYFKDYRAALTFAEKVARATGASIAHRLSTGTESLREMTASGLFVGMSVVVLDGEGAPVGLEPITCIEEAPGEFIDIDVDDASNFFAEGILTHNSIYEFRAAEPDEFIGKSDLVEGGEGFTTKLLDTNFRSGSAIVDAANQLIKYNSKQIPMTCSTDPRKGAGRISRVSVPTAEDGPRHMVDQILSDKTAAEEFGTTKDFYKQYGLAVRTNKEVYAYAMAMLEEGIPFRTKKNPLKGPAIEPIVGIFQVLSDDVQTRNKGVLAAMKAPDFGMNANTVRKSLESQGVRDYFDFLVSQGGADKVYTYQDRNTGKIKPSPRMLPKVEAFVEYLEEIAKIGKEAAASDLISLALSYKNQDGETFVDTLAASIENDREAMEELRERAAETEEGKITPEMIAEYAMEPIEPMRAAARKFPTAGQFTDYLGKLITLNQRNPSDDADVDANAVQIDTVHGWKGLEVNKLFVPMWQGGFPHARSAADPKALESERRLAYVALTRGEQEVTILEPEVVRGKEAGPSQFVEEACIPLSGTTKDDSEKTAGAWWSFEEYLKTAQVDDFIIPMPEGDEFEDFVTDAPDPIDWSDPELSWDEGTTRIEPSNVPRSFGVLSPGFDDLETAWGPFASEEN